MDHVMADITSQYIKWYKEAPELKLTGRIYWASRRPRISPATIDPRIFTYSWIFRNAR